MSKYACLALVALSCAGGVERGFAESPTLTDLLDRAQAAVKAGRAQRKRPSTLTPRTYSVSPRHDEKFDVTTQKLEKGEMAILVTGGVIVTVPDGRGACLTDIEADRLVIFTDSLNPDRLSPNDLEFYLAGNVEVRQAVGSKKNPIQTRTLRAAEVYYDVNRNAIVNLSATLEMIPTLPEQKRPEDKPSERKEPALGQTIEWRQDYPAARKEAAEKGRPMLLNFGTEPCYWCRQLDTKTFVDPAIVRMLNQQFVPLKVDANRHPALAEALRIENYPTMVFAASDGRVLGSQSSSPRSRNPGLAFLALNGTFPSTMTKNRPQKPVREIAVVGEVDDWEEDVIKALLKVPAGGECTFYIDSGGGSVYGALAVLTLIRQRRLQATAIVLGECSSAALLLFAACQRRFVTAFSVLLFHRMRGQSEKRILPNDALAWARHFEEMEQLIEDLQARLFGKAEDLVRSWTVGGQYVTGPQLVAAGLAELLEV